MIVFNSKWASDCEWLSLSPSEQVTEGLFSAPSEQVTEWLGLTPSEEATVSDCL